MNEEKKSKAGVIVAVVALIVVVAVAGFAYSAFRSSGATAPSPAAGNSSATIADSAGEQAAETSRWEGSDIAALLVTDQGGNEVKLGDFCNGRVTVINIWATWCPYCVDEMQDFQKLYDEYGSSIQFVMLDSADDAQEIALARDYVKEQGFTFPVFYDESKQVQRYFAVRAYPTTIVISSDGRVLANNPGRIDAAAFDRALSTLL